MGELSIKKYVRLKRDLLAHMAEKKMTPGDRLPAEAELANMFPVSEITVRRTLKELAEAGIVERIQGKGTFLRKKITAEDIAAGTMLFGMFGPDPFHTKFTDAIRKECESRGYALRLVWTQNGDTSEFLEAAKTSDGIFASGFITNDTTPILEALDTPHIIVGSTIADVQAPYVDLDWARAAEMLTEKLICDGARKPALLNSGKEYAPSMTIAKAFERTCGKHGLECSDNIVWTQRADWKRNVTSFFERHGRTKFDALICEEGVYDHFMAYLLAHAREMEGVRIGVLSSQPNADMYYGRLACSVFSDNLARESVATLLRRMAGKTIPRKTLQKPKIIDINDI